MENTAVGNGIFQDFFYEVPPIRIREPLAETLGAFKKQDTVVENGYCCFTPEDQKATKHQH